MRNIPLTPFKGGIWYLESLRKEIIEKHPHNPPAEASKQGGLDDYFRKKFSISEAIIYNGMINGVNANPKTRNNIRQRPVNIYLPSFPLNLMLVNLLDSNGSLVTISRDRITV